MLQMWITIVLSSFLLSFSESLPGVQLSIDTDPSDRVWWKGSSEGSLGSSSKKRGAVASPKQEPTLDLVHFSNKSITCNDGTTAGYYIRKSPFRSNNIWIVFLEGGWYCFNERSCQNRWLRLRNLMSSSTWPESRHVGGVLSSDPEENPYWANANHIFVPYCSSDTWSGTVSANDSGVSFSFMGALIVDEVFKNLMRAEGLKSDSKVILAGSSAGGTGAMLSLDRVENLLSQEFGLTDSLRVRGIADSGWFLDKAPSLIQKTDCNDVILCPPQISLRKGMSLWRARLPDNCRNTYPDQPWSCFFGYKLYPTLKGSLFVFQWLFDEAQMLVNNVPTPALRKEEWDYAYKLGDELKKSLVNVTSLMIPSCISHTILTHADWRNVQVNSVFLPRALKCWESGGIIEESNLIPSSRSSHMYWEEERASLIGVPAQIIESNDSSRKTRRRHHRHRNNNKDNNKKRRRRQRQKRLEDQLSLNNTLPHRRANKEPWDRNSNSQYETNNNNNRGHRRRKDNALHGQRSNEDERERNRLKRRRHRRWFSLCDAGDGGGLGGLRLVEKCSWPQCNKSCPKLLNPVTGEEVDFKDLLKSFGLDMPTMAKALGIDLPTLNTMDHQVLLHMLTQHS